MPVKVRTFVHEDAAQLLEMMVSLARFEDYIGDFAVLKQDLIQRGFGDAPEFQALVAHEEANPTRLLGMAVFYWIPFSYDLTAEIVLKELYVRPAGRGKGIGKALMAQLIAIARGEGCRRIKWLVLPENQRARTFYTSLGAKQDTKWENWVLEL